MSVFSVAENQYHVIEKNTPGSMKRNSTHADSCALLLAQTGSAQRDNSTNNSGSDSFRTNDGIRVRNNSSNLLAAALPPAGLSSGGETVPLAVALRCDSLPFKLISEVFFCSAAGL